MSSQSMEELRNRFRQLVITDRAQALRSLNHKDLKFPTLFAIRDQVLESGIFAGMNERNQWALKLTSEFLKEDFYTAPTITEHYVSESLLNIKAALVWMVKTGGFYAIHSSYLRVMDRAVIYTLNVFYDQSIMPDIVDIVFFRCRKELYYEHLCWAIFEMGNPDCLLLFAERLHSNHEKEKRLALKLLSGVPGLSEANPEEQYQHFYKWFYENHKFLVYKGESFDTTSHPVPFVPSLKAKYFGKAVTHTGNDANKLFNEQEMRIADQFDQLDQTTQEKLAEYSFVLRKRNEHEWKKWHSLSVAEQAKLAGEGLS